MLCVDSSAAEEVTAREEALIVANEVFLLSLTVADNGRGRRRARNSFTCVKDVEKLTATLRNDGRVPTWVCGGQFSHPFAIHYSPAEVSFQQAIGAG